MTAIQICALIGLIIGVALTYWAGYRGGLIDGRIEGIEEGVNRCQESQQYQQRQLDHLCHENQQLGMCYKLAKAAARLGEADRQSLLAIAEMLRVAAETFSAFRTGKKLHRDAIALREKAIAMAATLEPVSLGSDWVETHHAPISHEDTQKAQLFFRNQSNEIKLQKLSGGEE